MNVKIKDRKDEIEYLRMALNMCKIGVDYPNADLIIRVQNRLKKLKGKYSIKDSVETLHEWEGDWDKYFKENTRAEIKAIPEDSPQK